jgi:hypothetical protein
MTSRFLIIVEGAKDIWDPDRKKPKELSPAAIKRREKVLEQKSEITTKISETSRTIVYGTLATCYALLIADEKLSTLFSQDRDRILIVSALALTAILIDSAQYLFAYINIQQALAHNEQGYPRNWSRRWRQICFFLKQIFAYVSAFLLIWVIASTAL